MPKFLLSAAIGTLAVIALPASPAQAQNERVVTVFGSDPCPTSSAGDEIVICVRRDENERFRIPQELRTPIQSPENESWAARARGFEYVGRTGTMSCSPVGPGGWTGCYDQMVRQAREERRAGLVTPDPVP